jgi:hypothetical protein
MSKAASAEPAQAPAQPEPVLVVVDPANGCVTASEFFDQVRRRTPRAREAEPGESARRFSVTIENKVPVIGRLLTENTDGTAAVREVQGTSCQDVADALALVVAVTLDPLADQSRAWGNHRARGPRSARPSSGSPARLPPVRTTRAPPKPEPKARFEHALGGEATIRAGLIAQPMPGLGARYWGSLAAEGGAGLLLTVGGSWTFAADAEAAGYASGGVRYHLKAFDAGVCPVGARLGARVRLYPCGGLTLGELQAEGIQLPGKRSDSALFAAGALEVRWMIELTGPLGFVGAAGLSVPVQNYSVEVAGNEQPVDSTNPVSFVGALGLVLRTR